MQQLINPVFPNGIGRTEISVKNKKGEGYISTCVIIVIMCILFSVFMSFVTVVNTVRISKRNTKNVLDSFVAENSIDIYNSVKVGQNTLYQFDEDKFKEKFISYNELTDCGSYLKAETADGAEKYRIKNLEINFAGSTKLNLRVDYDIAVPLTFGGFDLINANIKVSVKTNFSAKF